jgi:ribosomal protein L37AE/L43A
MARTGGRKIRAGETARYLCDYCGTRWDSRELYRDAAGLWTCPQEGKGRDAVTLTRANVASAKASARDKKTQRVIGGRYDKDTAEPIG